MNNPFSVKTPETLGAEEIANLFIDVYSDFPRLLETAHTFLHGTRGTGKSMMLRFLEPSVQLAARKVSEASQLNNFSIHMPIRKANYSLSELERLQGAAYWLMSEHILTMHAVIHIINSIDLLISLNEERKYTSSEEWKLFCTRFIELSENGGIEISKNEVATDSICSPGQLKKIIEDEHGKTIKYLRKLTFVQGAVPYENALIGYADFLLPFVELVVDLDWTPNGPIFLMLDDGDNLSLRMQQVVNTWVSYRSTDQICLKISTQHRYKTWRTIQGSLIESPHDYSEIDINTVYTSKKIGHYYNQVEKVVQKRLEVYQISCSPEEFFPTNPQQEKKLKSITKKIEKDWQRGKGISSRKRDDVVRYKVSEYMKQLASSKKTNMYSYAGFRSMVDISSGVIRFFLEPASRMYSDVVASQGANVHISCIPHQVQEKVLEDWSKEYMLNHFDGLKRTEQDGTQDLLNKKNSAVHVKNLIVSFGTGFQKRLLSSDTERRLLSFMPTQELDEETQRVIDLAIEWGYLYRTSIGRKEGFGRNILYVFNRRLAPYFKLDPSGYPAHLSVSPEDVALATKDPMKFLRKRFPDPSTKNEELNDQLELFERQNGDQN